MKTDKLPQLGMDGVLCDRPQEGCVVGKFINRSNPRKEKTMTNTLSADQLSRYIVMRIRNPAAADRYWARCHGRNIAADAARDDEAIGKVKEFLKTKLSPGDHAQVCDMLEAAGGEPDPAAEDDLPENAAGGPLPKKASLAGDSADFAARFPGLAHVRIDNSGIQPRSRGGSYSDAAAKSFADRYPGLQGIKQA